MSILSLKMRFPDVRDAVALHIQRGPFLELKT
jgi:hypothetical protein